MKPQIIVADDEVSIRFGVMRYLAKMGYTVTEAASLGEARDLLLRRPFAAIILDLAFPDGNALDWIPALRQGWPGMAIIVMTGAGKEFETETKHRGADDFLLKPARLDDLGSSLRMRLQQLAASRKAS